MIQLGLIIICLVIIALYLRGKPKKPRLKSKIDIKAESYRIEIMRFLKGLKGGITQTKRRRLQIEMEKFNKARQLDEILEKAERERDSKKAIDYYLEAFSFITKNNFELDRKNEIEDKIKVLQGKIDLRVHHSHRK